MEESLVCLSSKFIMPRDVMIGMSGHVGSCRKDHILAWEKSQPGNEDTS